MAKTFRPWDVDQAVLFPPSLRDLVPEGHIAHFVRDVVREQLDLSEIYAAYTEERGFPPYHPAMMTALLLYGYCRGIRSSRKLEQSCEERVDFMVVTGMAKPDHSRISEFRRRHRAALQGLFAQVVSLCREAGLATLGHVAVDGTKVQANASKHAAMSYGRMKKAQRELRAQIRAWFEEADAADDEDDHVDQMTPVLEQIEDTTGERPTEVSADAGYCSEGNLKELERRKIRGYVASGRQTHGKAAAIRPTQGIKAHRFPSLVRMRSRLRRGGWRSRYRLRKQSVEPVFGRIKEALGLRRFLQRGLANVAAEWSLACTAHNLLKLAAARPALAP